MFTKNIFFVVVIFMTLNILFSHASPQQITFFENYGCTTGRNETILDTRDDLRTLWIANASSLLIVGLWKVDAKEPPIENQPQRGITIVHYYTQPPGGRCINKNDSNDWPNYQIYNAENIGPSADTANSEIQFYTDRFYQGLRYKASGDLAQVGPRPFAMLSYIHFSNDIWTVYSEKDFKGDVVHIYPLDKTDLGGNKIPEPEDAYTYDNEKIIIVGSIRKGLHDYDDGGGHSGTSSLAVFAPIVFFVAGALHLQLV